MRIRGGLALAAAGFLTAAGAQAGPTQDRVRVGDVERTYMADLPTAHPAPLVVVLHGNTQQGRDMASRTAWPSVARANGFGVLFPDGLNRAWADGRAARERMGRTPPAGTDDVAFIIALVEKYVAAGIADRHRVFVTGLSNGGAMTLTLACSRPDLFAAAAAVIMNMTDGLAATCRASERPVPLLIMNGTRDPLVPFDGGKGTSWFAGGQFWSTMATVDFWRHRNGCAAGDKAVETLAHRQESGETRVVRITSQCPAGHDVELYRVDGGGHRMPGRAPDNRIGAVVDRLLGLQNHDIDGADVIWSFFARTASQRPRP